KLAGWFSYYGKFRPYLMDVLWEEVNGHLLKWARKRYKRKRPVNPNLFRSSSGWNLPTHTFHSLTHDLPCPESDAPPRRCFPSSNTISPADRPSRPSPPSTTSRARSSPTG
ncbi:MAG: hypothetical protein JRI23_13090, partial [Deltaproteobacteria bacterium]|nr:hypothetical protein [Deltaproteobacteria bacterium]MBW2532658.1 hypothetical protein [Deltaproteobacteria bacterium]